jgi:type IV pilus assembly protein PilC
MPSIWQRDVFEFLPGWNARPLPLADTVIFCRKLSFLIGAGVSVKTALPIIEMQSSLRLKAAVKTVYASVCGGDSFASALKEAQVFPLLLCNLTVMGEAAGNLPLVYEQAAAFYERRGETKNELLGALMYPALVGILMLVVMVLAVTFVLPNYAQVFDASDIQLPLLTQVLLSISDYFMKNGLYVAAGAVIFVITGFVILKARGRDSLDGLILKIRLYRLYINARLSQALFLTLSAGLSITDAVTICTEISDNNVIKDELSRAAADVASGIALNIALSRIKHIDSFLTDMIRVGEETANLVPIIGNCEKYFDNMYSHAVKRMNKLVEPVMTIILGALLGTLMLAVILPTFQLAEVGW